MHRNESFRGDRGGFAPVHVGEEIDVKIEAVGEKGDGIAKIKGFVIFVPNAKQGEEIRVKITKVLRKVGFGEKIGDSEKKPASDGEESTDDSTEEASSDDEEEFEDSEDFGDEES